MSCSSKPVILAIQLYIYKVFFLCEIEFGQESRTLLSTIRIDLQAAPCRELTLHKWEDYLSAGIVVSKCLS
jgi:hypothetical protein